MCIACWMTKLTNKPTKEFRWPKEYYALMEIFRDVTSHSMLRFMIFSQPPNSSWTLLVFLPPGKGVLQTGRKTEHRGPWDSSFALKKPSLLLGLTPHSIPIIIPALRLSLFRDPNPHRLLVIPPSLSPICEGSPRPITLVVSWCLSVICKLVVSSWTPPPSKQWRPTTLQAQVWTQKQE